MHLCLTSSLPRQRGGRRAGRGDCKLKPPDHGFSDVGVLSTRQVIIQLERGERHATLSEIDDLASVLGDDLAYLRGRPKEASIDALLAALRAELLNLTVGSTRGGIPSGARREFSTVPADLRSARCVVAPSLPGRACPVLAYHAKLSAAVRCGSALSTRKLPRHV